MTKHNCQFCIALHCIDTEMNLKVFMNKISSCWSIIRWPTSQLLSFSGKDLFGNIVNFLPRPYLLKICQLKSILWLCCAFLSWYYYSTYVTVFIVEKKVWNAIKWRYFHFDPDMYLLHGSYRVRAFCYWFWTCVVLASHEQKRYRETILRSSSPFYWSHFSL